MSVLILGGPGVSAKQAVRLVDALRKTGQQGEFMQTPLSGSTLEDVVAAQGLVVRNAERLIALDVTAAMAAHPHKTLWLWTSPQTPAAISAGETGDGPAVAAAHLAAMSEAKRVFAATPAIATWMSDRNRAQVSRLAIPTWWAGMGWPAVVRRLLP